MPLVVEVIREGEPRKDIVWDYYALSCMYTAAAKEARPGEEYNDGKTWSELPEGHYVDFSMVPIYYLDWPDVPLVAKGQQTLKERHEFKGGLTFEPGDKLRAWREHK